MTSVPPVAPVVIDASVAIALLLDEPEGPDIMRSLLRWVGAGRRLIVPAHFWLEVVNRICRVPQTTGEQTLAAIHRLDLLGFESVEFTRGTLVQAIDRIERHRLTAYDAVYLAVAENLGASLATLDRSLAAAAGERAIVFDEGHRLNEPSARYEHHVTWPNYKEASAFLAHLRAEALAGRG